MGHNFSNRLILRNGTNGYFEMNLFIKFIMLFIFAWLGSSEAFSGELKFDLKPCDPNLKYDAKIMSVTSPHVGKMGYECVEETVTNETGESTKRWYKVFRITAEVVMRDFLSRPNDTSEFPLKLEPGPIQTWGYNGQTPGPTIEAIQSEWVRFIVTNKLPDTTVIHWHGLILPNSEDGGGTHTGKMVEPKKTETYEFQLNQYGTHMYHSGHNIAKQHALGLGGFFIIHPNKNPVVVQHDITMFLSMWDIQPHSQILKSMTMMPNFFTINGKSGPSVMAIDVKANEKVRVRFANLSMMEHPIHLHGHQFKVVARGAARWPDGAIGQQDTVGVKTGQPIEIEFAATKFPGTWLFHCHLPHHVTVNMEIDPTPGEPMIHDGAGMFTTLEVDRKEVDPTDPVEPEVDPHARHRAGAPLVGRYVGEIEMNDTGRVILAYMDIIKIQKMKKKPEDKIWRKFQITLKTFLGGFDSPEYLTETYEIMNYSFETGTINIENENKSFELQNLTVAKSEEEVTILGSVISGYNGEKGEFEFYLLKDGLDPIDPFDVADYLPPITGEYSGVCEGGAAKLQIESHRGLNGENVRDISPMGAYSITGRLATYNPNYKKPRITQSFDHGSYDFFNR